MSEILIGRGGDQPFPITAKGVSTKHASLTIREDGVWILRDLDSRNGTFVRNNRFTFERIEEKVITKDSIIRLGDETINGVTFMAIRLITSDINDYTYEFSVLRRCWNKLRHEKEKEEKGFLIYSFLPILLSLLCILFTLTPLFKNSLDPTDQLGMMRLLMILPSCISPVINYIGKRKSKLYEYKRTNLIVCPSCGRILTDQEVNRAQCFACRAHG